MAMHFDERGQEAQPADEAPPDASGEANGEELPPQPSRVGAAAPTTWQPAPGATASVLRFVRLLFSTEGAILVGLVAALYLLR